MALGVDINMEEKQKKYNNVLLSPVQVEDYDMEEEEEDVAGATG